MTVPIKTASIVIPSIRTKDATGDHTIDLARILVNAGIETTVICSSASDTLPEDISSILRFEDNPKKILARDLTILQFPHWSPLSECLRFAKGATIFWYHGVTPTSMWSSSDGKELLEISERKTSVAWYADLAICASPFTAAELHRHAAYPIERIRVVPLGVEVTQMGRKPNPETIEGLRQKWGLQDKQVLLYVGRVANNKRIDLLIDALALIANSFPKLVLLIVGDCSSTQTYRHLAEQLTTQAEKLGLRGRVILTDKVNEIAPFYHLADLFVHASQHEGFCIPLIEAMAAGVPIVASESGAMPWVLNATGNKEEAVGLTFTEGNSEELAQQLERLLNDQELRNSFVERAKKHVQNFDKLNFESRMRDVIAEAAALSSNKLIPSMENLYNATNVELPDYRVRSGVPIVGRLIELIRVNLTSHVKEAYLDRVIKRQVTYNRSLIEEIGRLNAEITRLRYEIEELQQKSK